MITRADILAEADRWLGTPFVHQGRVCGVGVDCIGLMVGIAGALGLDIRDRSDYGREPALGLLESELDAQWVRKAPDAGIAPSDILLMRFAREPQHVALVTDRDTIIHSYSQAGGCVEHRLAPVWRARIVRVYTWPGLEG